MLQVVADTKKHLYESTVEILLSIINETTGAPVTAQSPTVEIRRVSDGYFFDGAAFVDTLGVPTPLAMSEIGAIAAPGLYSYSLVDPGPEPTASPQPVRDKYQLRFANAGAPPTGGSLWDVREFAKELRDFNTQGS
ncbi:MAG: hypothetical protein ACWGQW_03870 [bacterium]